MLEAFYKDKVVLKLKDELKIQNIMDVPRLTKVVINSSSGEVAQNAKILDTIKAEIEKITGQKPLTARAKKSIAGFKIREGMPLGCFVTLRRLKMYEFLNKLINVSLPRSKDFKGLSLKGFDGRGNYTLGIKEQIIYPEISADKVDQSRGMNITIVTTAKTNKHAEALLRALGMPLRKS